MNIFLTGASGFIGGTIALRLKASGHRIRSLVRSPEKAARLHATGIEPVLGDLSDIALLAQEAKAADAVVNAASSDNRSAVEALLAPSPAAASRSCTRAAPAWWRTTPAATGPRTGSMTRTRRLSRCRARRRVAIDRLIIDAAAHG
jgi:uncharacterized protein YbjT (DUF2867 family)